MGAVDSAGTIRTGDSLLGEPLGGVVLGPDGTVYQTTHTATSCPGPVGVGRPGDGRDRWSRRSRRRSGGNGGGPGGNGGAGGDGGV